MPGLAFNYADRELRELAKLSKNLDKGMVRSAARIVKAASFAVEKRIKEDMPVDYGRARASWGHWGGGGGTGGSAADAIYVVSDHGLTVVQGSNVEYIEYLNRGSSKQAPAGFIDQAAQAGQLILEEELGLLDPFEAN